MDEPTHKYHLMLITQFFSYFNIFGLEINNFFRETENCCFVLCEKGKHLSDIKKPLIKCKAYCD